MKYLIFGKTGQLGRELQRQGGAAQLKIYGSDQANFETPKTCAALVAQTDADAVIIAAAYTAVDKAETDADRALLVNATTPGAIARAAAARGLPLLYISSDYVFDGAGDAAFAPDHPTAPLGVYGQTKQRGEAAVRAAGGAHVILRSSWVVSAHGSNFVKTMLRLGAERAALNVVADQIGGPTPAADLAKACFHIAPQLIADPSKSGSYHYSGGPDVSWADFAREIFAQAGLGCTVTDIPSAAYPTPAKRPLNSRLDNRATQAVFGLPRPDWRQGLQAILTQLHGAKP